MYSPKGGGNLYIPTSQPGNALATPTETNAIAGMSYGQNRAPNTISLRNQYNEYAVQMQSQGQEPLGFEEWAAQNFPDQKILNQQ